MSHSTKIFARKFKIKNFPSKLKSAKRTDEVVEFNNFFKYRFDWDAKYHFEVFSLSDGPDPGARHLYIYFYIICPPALLKNQHNFQLRLSIINKHYEKCHSKEWAIAFENNECKGWYQYLPYDQIIDKESKILVDRKLTLCCEIRALSENI